MAKPKRVASKPAASGRIAAGTPAPVVFSSAKPQEALPPKEDGYVPQPMEYSTPGAISSDGSFHTRLFDIAEEVQNRIGNIKAGQTAKNKESTEVAKKAAPAEISLAKARSHITNSIQAHKAGDSWTSTADMRDAVHHIANAVNYLNSGEGWGGEKRSNNAANYWAADSRRSNNEDGTKGPRLTNVHSDLTNILNGYLSHVKKANWDKKNHITNQGTDFSPETITPNSEFEGYGARPKANISAPKKSSGADYAAAAGKIIKPKYNPVGNLATVPAVLRREYGKQILPQWQKENPGKTFIGSDAHLHPEQYAKSKGIDLKYPSRALFSATGDPYHLIVPSMLEKEGNLSEEDITNIQKKETAAVSREKARTSFTTPLQDSGEDQSEAEAKITGAVRERPDVEAPTTKKGKKLTAQESLPNVPAAASKLKAGDVVGAARAVWDAHYNKPEPLPSDANMGQVKQWQKVQDEAFKAHPAGQNPAGFLDAHGYRVPGAGTRSMEFNAGQVK